MKAGGGAVTRVSWEPGWQRGAMGNTWLSSSKLGHSALPGPSMSVLATSDTSGVPFDGRTMG